MQTNKRIRTAQEFLAVEDVADGILYTTGGYLFSFLKVRGRDYSLLSVEDSSRVTDLMTQTLSEETEPWQLLSIPRTVDTRGMIDALGQMLRETDSDTRIKLLQGEISSLEAMAQDGAKEPQLILKLWKKAAPGVDKVLRKRLLHFRQKLLDCQIDAEPLTDEEILAMCDIYSDLGSWQPEDLETEDVPVLPGHNRPWRLRKETEAEARQAELLNRLTPVGGLFFEKDKAWIGPAMVKCCGVTRLPSDVPYGWAVTLFSATDCVTCLTYYPGQEAEIGNALSKSIGRARLEAQTQRDTRKQKEAERQKASGEKLLEDIDAKSKSIGHVTLLCMPFGKDPAALEDAWQGARSRFLGKKLKLRPLTCLQQEAFRHLSPYYPAQPEVDEMLKRIIPLETVIGGYPMTVTQIRDDHGLYFGTTPDGQMLSLDILRRSGDRTNGGGVVTGIPGIGKSTMLKHLLETMYMRGVSCIVIDPEREFRDLCFSLGGSWWDAGGGMAKANILEPLGVAQDPDTDSLSACANPLMLHIQQIQDIFRQKIPSLTDVQTALLKRALRQLYEGMGLALDMTEAQIRDIPHSRWPVMEDLYKQFEIMAKEDPRCEELALLIEDMAIGADAGIWNGATNIDLDNPMVVIDTNQLYNSSAENKRAQYFNLLRLAMSKITEDRTTPVLLICDEAQTLVNSGMQESARALLNIALRSRKYEGCLWLGIHSVHEFLGENIREFGQPILDAPTYKILFGTDGKALADTVDLYGLTASEAKVLEARKRGRALCLIGAQHLAVDFQIPAYKLALMGRGGGR